MFIQGLYVTKDQLLTNIIFFATHRKYESQIVMWKKNIYIPRYIYTSGLLLEFVLGCILIVSWNQQPLYQDVLKKKVIMFSAFANTGW